MKRVSEILTTSLALLLLSSAVVSGEDDSEIIQMLIDKAEEREQRFDDVEVHLSYERRIPRLNNWLLENSVHWVKSQQRRLVETRLKNGKEVLEYSKAADNGIIELYLCGTTGKWHGYVMRGGGHYGDYLCSETPDSVGVTKLPHCDDTIKELLEGKPGHLLTRGENAFSGVCPREVAILPDQEVDTLNCLVVELSRSPPGQDSEFVERLYFAKELNYACIQFEKGWRGPEGLKIEASWTMDDFQEVLSGLFFPFSTRGQTYLADGETKSP